MQGKRNDENTTKLQKYEERISQNIIDLREQHGWTRNKLSKITGISSIAIKHWETKKCSPSAPMTMLLCEKTGWKLSEIFGRPKRD